MTNTSRARLRLVPLCLGMFAACHSTRTIDSGRPVPQSQVHVRFGSPQTLVLSQRGVADLVLRDVGQLRGRAVGRNGDSVRVEISSAVDSSGRELIAPAVGMTTFVHDRSTKIEARQFNTRRTLVLVGSVTVALAVTYAAILVTAFTTGWGM